MSASTTLEAGQSPWGWAVCWGQPVDEVLEDSGLNKPEFEKADWENLPLHTPIKSKAAEEPLRVPTSGAKDLHEVHQKIRDEFGPAAPTWEQFKYANHSAVKNMPAMACVPGIKASERRPDPSPGPIASVEPQAETKKPKATVSMKSASDAQTPVALPSGTQVAEVSQPRARKLNISQGPAARDSEKSSNKQEPVAPHSSARASKNPSTHVYRLASPETGLVLDTGSNGFAGKNSLGATLHVKIQHRWAIQGGSMVRLQGSFDDTWGHVAGKSVAQMAPELHLSGEKLGHTDNWEYRWAAGGGGRAQFSLDSGTIKAQGPLRSYGMLQADGSALRDLGHAGPLAHRLHLDGKVASIWPLDDPGAPFLNTAARVGWHGEWRLGKSGVTLALGIGAQGDLRLPMSKDAPPLALTGRPSGYAQVNYRDWNVALAGGYGWGNRPGDVLQPGRPDQTADVGNISLTFHYQPGRKGPLSPAEITQGLSPLKVAQSAFRTASALPPL